MKLDFWKDNRLDQHFQLTEEEFKQRFTQFYGSLDNDHKDYYPSHAIAKQFVCASESEGGLQAVDNADDLEQIKALECWAYQVVREKLS